MTRTDIIQLIAYLWLFGLLFGLVVGWGAYIIA
jgi:hypothetical protein